MPLYLSIMTALLAVAILVIGGMYLTSPLAATRSFGLPPPGEGPGTPWWLRLKGVRDIATGLAVLALLAWGTSHDVGLLVLALSAVPLGDMLVILTARGSRASAFGIHGATALVMLTVAVLILAGTR